MLINDIHTTAIRYDNESECVVVIDQTQLPHNYVERELRSLDNFCTAIRQMWVRGAPLIGATAAYGMALCLRNKASLENEEFAYRELLATRPTAINLRWALDRVRQVIKQAKEVDKAELALAEAHKICQEDIKNCEQIGENGLEILKQIYAHKKDKSQPVNVLTHCNAGWLATVDWGTATAPIYKAQVAGIPIHVWVDETRPRNQGASLTAYELGQQGVAHTVIADNTGGHLMQHRMVDICLVGSDRTTANGDVCNKIGTYLKALAAHDNNIPFYVTLPVSSVDWTIKDGLKEIPIEQRDPAEVLKVSGKSPSGDIVELQLTPDGVNAANYAFDVTPARYVTGLITEHGIFNSSDLSVLKSKLGL